MTAYIAPSSSHLSRKPSLFFKKRGGATENAATRSAVPRERFR